MKILLKTFPSGHLVSDIEYERLAKSFAKAGMELVKEGGADIVLVKGFSHTWDDVKDLGMPVVLYSIGAEYKKGIDLVEANKPLKELYEKAAAVAHISEFCRWTTDRVFGPREGRVIIPACEPNLPKVYIPFSGKLRLATTCIPRPVKRVEETERLCRKFKIELIPAYGNIHDFTYYRKCHAYVHLSRKEGMPNTVLEAMSWGLPCIVTNYGGAKEAVGDAGIVIKNDPEEAAWDMDNVGRVDDFLFRRAIEDLTARLWDYRLRVRRRVLSELNDDVCGEQFKQLFESL